MGIRHIAEQFHRSPKDIPQEYARSLNRIHTKLSKTIPEDLPFPRLVMLTYLPKRKQRILVPLARWASDDMFNSEVEKLYEINQS